MARRVAIVAAAVNTDFNTPFPGLPLTLDRRRSLILTIFGRRFVMLSRSARMVLLGAVTLAACGANPADVEEIKKGQKDILAKLGDLEKAVQQVKAAPPAQRPQLDPNKVYNIPGNAYLRGPKTAKVTIAEFSDFQ
jgi:hypothetical protein